MSMLDRRLNAYRPDLADERLSGKVEASRFTTGTLMQVSASVVDLRSEPRPDSGPQTQIIFGDMVRVFEEQDGWSWVQAERDGYTGYVSSASLEKPTADATHMVIVPRTFIYPGSDLRFPHTKALSLGSRVRIVGSAETRGTQYALLENGEALIAGHLAPLDQHAADYVAVAETLLHTPYLWGGTSGFGIDCSGIVQLSMWVSGRKVLRDSDMQQNTLGEIVEPDDDYSNLKRGDLVFWKGHVAICASPDMLIHASGHTMTVTLEPLRDAIKRIAYLYDLPTLIRRP
ncbi:peptidase P60 [Ochrobactrum sp. MYb15]|nr:peptidase P60 [Ochrobactrum sp. MYb19]PRA57752.1 peptidase P60 [Ochrobactrum sp. MYb68]PRA67138.1 peptidase P60 [Ochrobactrum sp. MYb18]PRA77903.1 peptidase P60 [Brucella thiophenivorans]PRA92148.1 peptidase P60 [Ochrobactrum sp. MYb14]PRA99913.1 peptidase P60 [Ochrobactrum sp. MYb15]